VFAGDFPVLPVENPVDSVDNSPRKGYEKSIGENVMEIDFLSSCAFSVFKNVL